MKKVGFLIIGMVIGASLMLAASVSASSLGLIGKKVQDEVDVLIDGKNIGSAIIVDNKTYAPVRPIGEAAQYDVGYKSTAGNKVVTLTTRTGDGMDLETIDYEIKFREKYIADTEKALSEGKVKEDFIERAKEAVSKYKDDLVELYKKKAELESAK
ncbi:hypothetical protein [Paenibacillus gorillae]|uniref:hypothetical protein n=1 Tax=Paenibacillus gorillae TaxID=1243662 RepID=UPI0004B21AD5|nr:hypothetical protein [Paenibacillus gorillae]